MTRIVVPGYAPVDVPSGWSVSVADPPPRRPVADADRAVRDAIANPVAGPSLAELAREALRIAAAERRPPRVVLAVTDATRDCPDQLFAPAILADLRAGGVAPEHVTIVVATGLHRPSTEAEKRAKLGDDVVEQVRVVDHDALDAAELVDLGAVAGASPAIVNRRAAQADLLLSTGVVEPHQYAGWSGGGKTVAIGLAGDATIALTHDIRMLAEPGVRLARLEGNPFAAAVAEIARRVRLRFVVNAVLDVEGQMLAVAAGEPDAVHRELVSVATLTTVAPVRGRADVVVAGVPAAKAANLYQASRAVTYLHFAPVPVAQEGGVYVLPAAIPEGVGQGTGERRSAEALREAAVTGPVALLERLQRDGARAGEQRAYMVATVLRDARIVVAGPSDPAAVTACGMIPEPTLAAAVDRADRLVREPGGSAHGRGEGAGERIDVLVVPDAIRTLPVVTDGAGVS